MSIDTTASTNYLSGSAIEAWMEQKTEALYGNMRTAMDESNARTDSEKALNELKAEMAEVEKNGGDASALRDHVHEVLAKYPDNEDLVTCLTPIAKDLDESYDAAVKAAAPKDGQVTYVDPLRSRTGPSATGIQIPIYTPGKSATPLDFKISEDDKDAWSKSIGDTVDALGKEDQLGLINIQEFNSQINQTKQIASALLDAAEKAATDIIRHIA